MLAFISIGLVILVILLVLVCSAQSSHLTQARKIQLVLLEALQELERHDVEPNSASIDQWAAKREGVMSMIRTLTAE